jgi:hypothetical protein
LLAELAGASNDIIVKLTIFSSPRLLCCASIAVVADELHLAFRE